MSVTIYNGEYTTLNTRKQAGFLAGKVDGTENVTTRRNTEIRIGFVEYIKETTHQLKVAAWSVSDWEDAANIRDYQIDYDIEFRFNNQAYTINGTAHGTVNTNIIYCPDIDIAISDATRGLNFSLTVTKVACRLFQKDFLLGYVKAGVVNFSGSGTTSINTATSVDVNYRIDSASGTLLKTISGTPTKPLIQNIDTIDSENGHYRYSNWKSQDTDNNAPVGSTIYPGDNIYSQTRTLLKYKLTLLYNKTITSSSSSDCQSMELGEFVPGQKVPLPLESNLTFTLESNHMIVGVSDIVRSNIYKSVSAKYALGSTVNYDVKSTDNDDLKVHLTVVDKNKEYSIIPNLWINYCLYYNEFVKKNPLYDTKYLFSYPAKVKVKYGEKPTSPELFYDSAFSSNNILKTKMSINTLSNYDGTNSPYSTTLIAALQGNDGTVKSYNCLAVYNQNDFQTAILLINKSNNIYVLVASPVEEYCKITCDGEESKAPIRKSTRFNYYIGYHHTPVESGIDVSPFKRPTTYGVHEPSPDLDDPLSNVLTEEFIDDIINGYIYVNVSLTDQEYNCFRDTLAYLMDFNLRNSNTGIKSEGTWRQGIPYKKIDGEWKQLLPFHKSGNKWECLRKFAVDFPSTKVKMISPADKYFRLNMYQKGKDVASYWIQTTDTKQNPMPDNYMITRNQALSYVYQDSPITVTTGTSLSLNNRGVTIPLLQEECSSLTTSQVTSLREEMLRNTVFFVEDDSRKLTVFKETGLGESSDISTNKYYPLDSNSLVQIDPGVNFAYNSDKSKIYIIYTTKFMSSNIDLDNFSFGLAISQSKLPYNNINYVGQYITRFVNDTLETYKYTGMSIFDKTDNTILNNHNYGNFSLKSSPFHYDILGTHNKGFLLVTTIIQTDTGNLITT